MLVLEVDRLSQYQRRSNVVIRNMFLPENESLDQLNNNVVNNERKNAKHIKINPNLTKRRGKILYDAVKLTEELPKVNFVFSDPFMVI